MSDPSFQPKMLSRAGWCAGASLLAAPFVSQSAEAAQIKVENLGGFQKADQRSAFQVRLAWTSGDHSAASSSAMPLSARAS